ncbi:MAG: NAD(P)H-hydrate dehydratase [Gammaproteobacteria bacterium]|nr:NAD(P)H-hydrate dehydratase [Gammaproteobacteria bacterium]MBU1415524.1 NAD(P)H-hydrate dehydratase [Gammaproteobacteria bacterium]
MIDSTAIFRTAGIRAIEARFADATPPLMERAGASVAASAREMLGNANGPLLIVAGPGNNGGDGLVAARILTEQGCDVTVVQAASEDIPERDWRLVIDAIFGIGLTRPVAGRLAEVIAQINALSRPVLAIDVPSGLCADTGRVLGSAVHATRTISFIAGKPGLYTLDGPDHCGEVAIDGLGLDVGTAEGQLISSALFGDWLRPRRHNAHKGDYGSVGVIGGAPGMAGAALLAGRAALQLGAGRVYVGMLERLAVDPQQPELMLRNANDVLSLATALAVGPGLGRSIAAAELLRRAIDAPLPLVLDADALNLLAVHPVFARKVSRRDTPSIVTPHPAEAARLLGTTTEAVQADRIAAALELARRHGAVAVLKGCGSIVATPQGKWFVNSTGNAGLASAGSGDVLTGIVAALLAQHWPPLEAALAAVHLHGAAADALVAAGIGPIGLSATEIIPAARALLNRWAVDA